MEENKLRFPELTSHLRSKRLTDFMKFFGPGAIIASVTIGSGETLWASRSGAIFGYSLFWAFSLFCLAKGIQVYTAARYMTLTGEHPIERWAFLPGPRAWFPAFTGLVVIVAFPFYLSSLPIMLGSIVSWALFGDPHLYAHPIAIGSIVLLIVMTLLQSYGFLEKVQTSLIGIMLFVMIIAAFAAKPDWGAAVAGALIPTLPQYPDWVVNYPDIARRTLIIELVAYMGVMGGGVQDYLGYVGMLREKAWGLIGRRSQTDSEIVPLSEDSENVRLGLNWLRAPLIDNIVSFSCVLVFTFAFLILGAALLHPRQLAPSGMDLYNHQVVFLTQLHPNTLAQTLLDILYKVGIFFAIMGTVYGAFELYVRTAHECIRVSVPKWRDLPLARIRLSTLIYAGVGAIGMVLYAWWTAAHDPLGVGWDPISIMTIPLHITGVLLAGPWCFAMIWTDRKFLPKPFQMGRPLLVLNLICGIIFTFFGARAVYDDILPLLNWLGGG